MNTKARRRIRIYLLIIVSILGFIGYKLFYYIPKINENKKAQLVLEKEYADLLKEEDILSSDVLKLKDDEYIARFAREKYLYSRDGEIIIRIID